MGSTRISRARSSMVMRSTQERLRRRQTECACAVVESSVCCVFHELDLINMCIFPCDLLSQQFHCTSHILHKIRTHTHTQDGVCVPVCVNVRINHVSHLPQKRSAQKICLGSFYSVCAKVKWRLRVCRLRAVEA